jgi:hypothetical protein
MGFGRRTGHCRLPDLRRRVEFRRLSIVRVRVIFILILILGLLGLLGVLAVR